MKGSLAMTLALALTASVMASHVARAQFAPTSACNDFMKLRDAAREKGEAIGAAEKRQADRKEVCTLVTRFAAAEGAAVKFLEDNKTWCGIPDQAVSQAKLNHEKTLKFRTVVCSNAPEARPKAPTLSDTIGTPTLDTSKNTKTGPGGTFDTLTGNPLAR
ncbi:MAG TPA: hypothetical protein VGJ20_35975 [Xanthobacteraceae bacterium]|jgi:hypothetical protein